MNATDRIENVAKRPSFFLHLHPPTIPAREARFWYTFGLGGLSLYLFIVLTITGALELIYYVPSAAEANHSLHLINLLVPYGQLVRSLHFWAAQALVVTSILHMIRIVLSGAYKPPRRFNWLLGLGLLLAVLLFDFTGYGLRWDSDIAWALTVGTNLLKSIPVVGAGLYALVVGGPEIDHPTIVRFFGWHIYGLPLIAIFMIFWHIFRVRRDGGISRSEAKAETPRSVHRSELARREVLAALIASILLLSVAALFPPGLGPSADFANLPAEATAPWFFVWIQQMLRLGPPFLMGVFVPFVFLVTLALLPYVIDRSAQGVAIWFNAQGRWAQGITLAIVALILALTAIGASR